MSKKIQPQETNMSLRAIRIKTCDGEEFQVDRAAALACISKFLRKEMDKEQGKDAVICLEDVSGPILREVISWCDYHQEDEEDEREVMTCWDRDFLKKDSDILAQFGTAAVKLEIDGLTDMVCKTFAETIKGKSTEEMRKYFHVKDSGFTPEEEEQMRREDAELQLAYNNRILFR